MLYLLGIRNERCLIIQYIRYVPVTSNCRVKAKVEKIKIQPFGFTDQSKYHIYNVHFYF